MAAPPVKKKYNKLDPQNKVNVGLEQLYPPPDDKSTTKITLDIIAIPGLGANKEWTWVNKKVHWLRDSNMLASRVPGARISVFAYESQWFGKGSVDQRLDNVADQLLSSLEWSRKEGEKTPIVFISHCLGGIVLERALVTARLRQNDYPTIFPYVAGTVFLGTPFHGTKTQQKANVLAQMSETLNLGVASSLLKLLEKDSTELSRMLDEFVRLSHDAQIRIFCFFESHKSDLTSVLIKGMPDMFKTQEVIVDQDSATWPGVDKLQLDSDHFKLNKYDSPKDPNFVKVSNEIKATALKAPGIIKSRQNALRQMLVDSRTYHAILDALGKGFVDFDSTIKGPNKGPKAGKPSWIISTDTFNIWRTEPTSPLLWIHGKTGTLEDSIASSAIECLHAPKEQGDITVSFFCDQSDEIRRSLRGMLMLLIRQLIEFDQDLAVELLTDVKRGKNAGKQDFDPESFSKASTLWDALHSMARKLGPGRIRVVVYGLELLSQESIREFADYLTEMITAVSSTNQDILPIKWMLLSRSGRPDIEKALKGKSSEINLNDSCNLSYVSDALRADISARVDDLDLPKPLAYFIKRHIHSRAEDNFIYVSLVIQELKNAQETKKATHAEIRALLESFPYGLTDMYEHVRKRVLRLGAEGLDYTKEILRSMIASERAPTLRELALMADLPEDDQDDLEAIKKHIIRCGAFLTVTGSWIDEDSNIVEWVDMSAPEHLQKYAKEDLALDPELMKMQHGIIALRCLEHLYSVIDYAEQKKLTRDESSKLEADADAKVEDEEIDSQKADAEIPSSNVEGNDDDKSEHDDEEDDNDDVESQGSTEPDYDTPEHDWIEFDDENMQYPIQYWIEHAKKADVHIIEEFQTGHSFWREDSESRQKWWNKNESMHQSPDQTDVSVLHVATIAAYPALIDRLLQDDWETDVHKEDSLGNQPLFYACSGGNYEIVETLLGAKADINFVSNDDRVTALYGAASNGHMDIVRMLLERDADIDANSNTYGTPLYAATDNGHTEVIKLLIQRKAKVNLIGGLALRPLNVAAFNGDVEAVGILIDNGADVDPDQENWYGSALGAAARRGHIDVVELLLSKGWSPSRHMKTYGSFLTAAATYGHVDVVEALLQKEARVTVLEQALQAASQNGKAAVVKLILDRTPTLRHQKAFMLAASYGREEILKLLHTKGMPQDKLDAALYDAADHEHEQTVKLLLDFGANPDAEGKEYGTALTASAYDGTTGILVSLLEHKADVNKRGGDFGSALQAAALFGDAENVKLLVEHGAHVNTEVIGYYGNPLQAACYSGDIDTVKFLLENHADVNAYGGDFNFAIIAAADEARGDIVKLLLEHGAHVNVKGTENNKPLIAIAGGTLDKDDLQVIIDHGADVNATCDKGTTALILCADAWDPEGLEFLLAHGADVHVSSVELGTALHAAAAEGDEDSVEILLKAGADVHAIGGAYGTALQAAAYADDMDTVKKLLESGAAVDMVAGEYGCALQAASFVGADEIVTELLLTHNAIVDNPCGKYGYALQAAASLGQTRVVEILLENGADVNRFGGMHGTALLAAAALKTWNDDVIDMLLEHGADVAVGGGLYHSAAQAAAVGNTIHALRLFIEKGSNVNARGGKFGSALQAAALRADVEFMEELFKHGADAKYQGGKYDTALQAAAYADRMDVVNLLLDNGADYRLRGGKYGSALTAAAVKGSKAILEKFLMMMPPEQMLDESLVEACYYRQSASVEALLKSGANVYARHPTLGFPIDALLSEAPDGYNSDDESEEPMEDDEEDGEEDEEEEAWEGDESGSVVGSVDGSVTNLQLEDEVTDVSKIQKLLDEAMARVKRNPTVKRFRTVKKGVGGRYGPNAGGNGSEYPPPLRRGGMHGAKMQNSTSYTQFNPQPPMPENGQAYGQQRYQSPPQQQHSFQAYPGTTSEHYSSPQSQHAYQQQLSNTPPSLAHYQDSSQVPRPASQSRISSLPPARKPVPGHAPSRSQSAYASSDPQGHQPTPPPPGYGTPLPSTGYGTPPPLPSRNQIPDPRPYASQLSGPGSAVRYQQQQADTQPQPQPHQQNQPTYSGARVPYAAPPLQHQYSSPQMGQGGFMSIPPPQQQYNRPPQDLNGAARPLSGGYQSSPPPSSMYHSPEQMQGQFATPQPFQAYQPYSTPRDSLSSIASSTYPQSGQSTLYGGSQDTLGGYPSPNSSVGRLSVNGQGGQKPRWGEGGYEGEGYE